MKEIVDRMADSKKALRTIKEDGMSAMKN